MKNRFDRRNTKSLTRLRWYVAVVIPAVLIVTAMASSTVLAAPVAPNWLPGQPMLAGQQIIAMWLPVPGATKYIIYMNGKKMIESPANQYIGTAPAEAGEYRFEVSAVDASGAEGEKSRPGIVKIIVVVPPGEIIFRALPEEKAISLRWDKTEGAAFFNLYRSTSKDGPFGLVTSVQETSYKDAGLELPKTYYYTVSAKDLTGTESKQSAPVEVRLEEAVAEVAVGAQKTLLSIQPTELVDQIEWLGDYNIQKQIGTLAVDEYDSIYIGDRRGYIHVVDKDLQYVKTIVLNQGTSEAPKLLANIVALVVLDGGREFLLASTDQPNVIRVAGNGQVIAVGRLFYPTKEQDPQVYALLTGPSLTEPMGFVTVRSIVPLPDGRILAGSSRDAIIWVLNEKLEVEDWVGILDWDGKEERMGFVTSMVLLGDGKLLINQGLRRAMHLVDPDTWKVFWRHLTGSGFGDPGTVLGAYDVVRIPGNLFVTSDPALQLIQAWDIDTGKYAFTYGTTKEPKVSTKNARRPQAEYRAPSPFAALSDGRIMYRDDMFDDILTVRRPVGPPVLMEKE